MVEASTGLVSTTFRVSGSIWTRLGTNESSASSTSSPSASMNDRGLLPVFVGVSSISPLSTSEAKYQTSLLSLVCTSLAVKKSVPPTTSSPRGFDDSGVAPLSGFTSKASSSTPSVVS